MLYNRCSGTEAGNPTITETDLSGGVAYFSNAGDLSGLSAKKSNRLLRNLLGEPDAKITIRMQSQSTATSFPNAPLLKLTDNGTVVPAITVKDFAQSGLPKVTRMAKLGDDFYALFNLPINVNGSLCKLLKLQADAVTCVDSQEHPAKDQSDDPLLPRTENQRNFLVASVPGSTSDVYYKTTFSADNQATPTQVAVRSGSATQLYGPSDFGFGNVYQHANGTLYANDCDQFDTNNPPTTATTNPSDLLCKIEATTVTSLSPALDAAFDNETIEILASQDKVIVSLPGDGLGQPDNMHLRVGNLGDTVNATNFTQDIKTGLSAGEIEKTYRMHGFFETIGNGIWGINASTGPSGECLIKVSSTYDEHCLAQQGFSAIEYISGESIVAFYLNSQNTCGAEKIDPVIHSGGALSCVDANVTVARYIQSNTLVAGGASFDGTGYKYYKLNTALNQSTLLFTSDTPLYLHVF